MSSVVGNENLPNAYIRRISIYNSDTNSSNVIMLSLCVKDVKSPAGTWGWFDDHILRENMSILCVICYNQKIINSITKGEVSLSPRELTKHPDFTSGDIEFKTIPIKVKKFKKNLNTGLHSLHYSVKYTLKSDPYNRNSKTVAVFAASYINFDQMASKIGGEVPTDYSVFHGPIQSDYVFRSGKIPDQSEVLVANGGAIYAGPVHKHGDQMMAGSKHSAATHPTLSSKKVDNIKIKDYTKFSGFSKSDDKNKKFVENYFSNLYYTSNEKEKVNSVFFLNMAGVLLSKSRHGRQIAKFSSDIFAEIVAQTKINNMTVKRIQFKPRRVRSGLSNFVGRSRIFKSEEVVSTSDHKDQMSIKSRVKLKPKVSQGTPQYVEIPRDNIMPDGTFKLSTGERQDMAKKLPLSAYKYVFEIEELSSESEPTEASSDDFNIRGFKMTDHLISLNDDAYTTYSLDVKIIDPTIVYINSVLVQMQNDLDAIKQHIYRMTSSSKYYDFDLDMVKDNVLGKESPTDFVPQPVTQRYVKYSALVSVMDDIDATQAETKMNGYIESNSLTRKSAMEYLRKYRNLYHAFQKKYHTKTRKYNTKFSRKQKIYQTKTSATIEVSNTFSEAMNFKNYEYSYNYHEKIRAVDEYGLFSLSDEQFLSRGSTEMDKHGNFVLDSKALKNSTELQQKALLDVISHKKTYVTPMKVSTPKGEIKISKPQVTSIKKINNVFSMISKPIPKKVKKMNMLRPRILRSNDLGNNNKMFTIVKPLFNKYTFKSAIKSTPSKKQPKDVDFIDAKDYLGESSPFVSSQESSKSKTLNPASPIRRVPLEVIEKLKIKFNLNLRATRAPTMRNFDLNSETNLLTNRDHPKDSTIAGEKIKSLPYSIKTLLSPTNFLDSIDVLKLPETSAYMNIKHFAVQKIQYLNGFKYTSDGYPMLKVPLWVDIDEERYSSIQSTFLCKFEDYKDESHGVALSDHMRLNIHDSLFEVTKPKPDESRPIPTPVIDLSQITRFPEYMSSNLIKQTRKRDAINDKFVYDFDNNPLGSVDVLVQGGGTSDY